MPSYQSVRQKLAFKPKSRYFYINLFEDAVILSLVAWTLRANSSQTMYWFGQLLLSCFFFKCFGIFHEAVHGTLFKNRKANNWVGLLYGIFCFLPFDLWKDIHLKHHYWAGNIQKDPSLGLIKNFNLKNKFKNKLGDFCWQNWIPFFGFMQQVVFWQAGLHLLFNGSVAQSSNRKKILFVLQLVGTIAIFALVFSYVSPLKLLPSFIVYLMLVEAINFPHHLDLPMSQDLRLNYKDQHLIARSCRYNRLFEVIILKNFNYHTEHHLYPDLPWHQLRACHELLTQSFSGPYNFSPGFAWISERRKIPMSKMFQPDILAPEDIQAGNETQKVS